MATAVSNRCGLWFGTRERSQFFKTPLSGADSSPQAWGSSGTTLNGHGYSLGSWGSHKVYNYEWSGASAREVAQLMKSYADGTYGRGLIYFQDPLTFDTNVLPARLADPSMALGYEGTSLVYGVQPTATPTGANTNDLPVTSAVYDLAGVTPGFRGEQQAIYVPIPEGYTLFLGAFYSASGTGGVFASPQNSNGSIGSYVRLSELSVNSETVVQDQFSGIPGVWIWTGRTTSAASSVTLRAMVGRLLQTGQTQSREIARNLFTNPRLVGDGTRAEVRRNLHPNPNVAGTSHIGWGADPSAALDNISRVGTGEFEDLPAGGSLRIISTGGSASNSELSLSPPIAVTEGDTITMSVYSVSAGGSAVGGGYPAVLPRIQWSDSGFATGVEVTLSGQYRRLSITAVVPAGVTSATLRPHISPLAAGGVVRFRAAVIEKQAEVQGYFDGSTTPEAAVGVIQPEDFRWRFVGAENASESVMEIEQVRGVSGNIIAGVSTDPVTHKPALRQINLNRPTGDSYTQVVGGFIDTPGVLIGTSTTLETIPVPEGLDRGIASLRVGSPYTSGSLRPNTPGTYSQRLVFDARTSIGSMRLNHGGVGGDPDVWWTDIGLFAGVYDGPAFSGSDPAGNNLVYSWAGAVDNSESIATFTPPQLTKLLRGPWMGGQGNAGCRFEGKPTYIEYNGVGGGQVGFAATFREVG